MGGIGMMAAAAASAASASAAAAASDGGWDPASGGHLVMKNLMIPPDLPPGLFLPGSALVVAGLAVNAAIQLWIGGHDEFKRDEGETCWGEYEAHFTRMRRKGHVPPFPDCPSSRCRAAQRARRQQQQQQQQQQECKSKDKKAKGEEKGEGKSSGGGRGRGAGKELHAGRQNAPLLKPLESPLNTAAGVARAREHRQKTVYVAQNPDGAGPRQGQSKVVSKKAS